MSSVRLTPVSFQQARAFVRQHHRHADPPIAVRVSVGIEDADGTLRGVGMLGIPKARMSMDGKTAEVIRVATDGIPNGCSMLYGALVRAAWALGYNRVLTYTLPTESGVSLRAAGWENLGEVTASSRKDWSQHTNGLQSQQKPTMFFEDKVAVGPKIKWQKVR